MKKISPIVLTEEETDILNNATAVIAGALERFHEANKTHYPCPPQCRLTINDSNPIGNWLLDLTGFGYAGGETLDEAFTRLCNLTDAEKIRERAKMYRMEAEELDRRAEEADRDQKGTEGGER